MKYEGISRIVSRDINKTGAFPKSCKLNRNNKDSDSFNHGGHGEHGENKNV